MSRPYRLDVSLPRELNEKLEALARESRVKLKRRVSKSDLVVKILEQFFEKKES